MKSLALLFLVAGTLLGADSAPKEKQDDLKSIQGTWQIVAFDNDGRAVPEKEFKDLTWRITEDKIFYTLQGKPEEWSYSLDATKKPRWLNLMTVQTIVLKRLKPAVRTYAQTALGIYELDGDTLKVCYPQAHWIYKKKRSTAFESKEDSPNDVLMVLRRVKR